MSSYVNQLEQDVYDPDYRDPESPAGYGENSDGEPSFNEQND